MDIASVPRIVGRIVGWENCVFPSLHDSVIAWGEWLARGQRPKPPATAGAGSSENASLWRRQEQRAKVGATVRSFSHAECRSLTHGVAGVAAIPSEACWRGVELRCCDELGRHPCCSLGMLRLNFEAPACRLPLADALRGLQDGKWPRWASAHICRCRGYGTRQLRADRCWR